MASPRLPCRRVDPEVFFPIGDGPGSVAAVNRAKEICSFCPIRQECLNHALTTNQQYGVWGGASENERRQLQRSRLRGGGTVGAEGGG